MVKKNKMFLLHLFLLPAFVGDNTNMGVESPTL